ncbi:hypothetical protein AB833_22835 [Chromatiales bacterium (ex Bugula neritina AB1)]|nr:hypothetical protein AB833_22835 [Chromatiales bacterium (ex Bugula neritina AB1)]
MTPKQYSSRFPISIPVGSSGEIYQLSDKLCATESAPADNTDEQPEYSDGPHSYVLKQINSVTEFTGLLPVYEKGPDIGIATGQISIRLDPEITVLSIASTLKELGYQILSTPGYAPHSGWLASSSGEISQSLDGLNALTEKIKPRHLEVQLLRSRGGRPGPED